MTREEAKKYIIQHCNPDYPNGNTEWETAMNMAISALQQPEVMTCRECYHYPNEFADCPLIGWPRNENDFCSKAEGK